MSGPEQIISDEEVDALVELLRNHWLGPHDDARAADAITALRTQLAEALETWPIWAVQIKDKLQSYGVDPGDEWNVAEQFEAWLDEAVSYETARADRAEAALAVQIEANALVCDELAAACAMAQALAANDTPEVRTAVAYSIKIAKRCAATIRAQPHDRTALDRMLAEAREQALREAAEICSNIRQRIASGPMPEGARFDYEQSILALIEATNAQP